MVKLVRAIAIGASIGLAGAAAIAAPAFLQNATAQDQVQAVAETAIAPIDQLFPKTPGFDMSRLKKFDFSFDAAVSVAPQSTVRIDKYGYGQHRSVTISTTSSGTYSSDAITSPYVRYPGIRATRPAHHCGCWAGPFHLDMPPPGPQEQHDSSFMSVPAPQPAAVITWL